MDRIGTGKNRNDLGSTAEAEVYDNNYNGTSVAYQELGPLSPSYGNAFYNPN